MIRIFLTSVYFQSLSLKSLKLEGLKRVLEVYSDPCQISKLELFAKLVNNIHPSLYSQKAPS